MIRANSTQLVRAFGIIFFGLLLNACGFHLRGTDHPQLTGKVFYLESKTPFGALENSLRRDLQFAGATVSKDGETADVRVILGELAYNTQGVSRDNTGRANEVVLRASLSFEIVAGQQTKPEKETESRQLKASRSYYQDYRNPLSEQNLRQQASQDVVDELAERLVSQVAWTLGR